jgi:deoxyribodipyrimidine photolyase-related protein
MKYDIFIIFPIQLFDLKIYPIQANEVYLCEDPYFLGRPGLHQAKIKYHLDTLGRYFGHIKANLGLIGAKSATYFGQAEAEMMWEHTSGANVAMYDPIEHSIRAKVEAKRDQYGFTLAVIDSPYFPETKSDLKDFIELHGEHGPWRHDSQFYRWQRRRLGLLMANDAPLGGQWSFDKDNRAGRIDDNDLQCPIGAMKGQSRPNEAVSKQENISRAKRGQENTSRTKREQKAYCWPDVPDPLFPIDHLGAIEAAKGFIGRRLALFGKYQDVVAKDMDIGWHSCLSCVLNVGLITPM